jgi:hypothetical protein
MALLTCRLCGKLFTSAGDKTCPACIAHLDQLYPEVREFLRDRAKTDFNVEEVATEMNVDIRYIQALVDKGYLDRDADRRTLDREDVTRQKLARELENSLKQMKDSAARREAAKNSVVSYGQQRYGEKDKRK